MRSVMEDNVVQNPSALATAVPSIQQAKASGSAKNELFPLSNARLPRRTTSESRKTAIRGWERAPCQNSIWTSSYPPIGKAKGLQGESNAWRVRSAIRALDPPVRQPTPVDRQGNAQHRAAS